jgi:hypothetical protein
LPRIDAKWGKAPAWGNIGSFDFIVRRDVWHEAVEVMASGVYHADYLLIERVWLRHGPEIPWLNVVVCAVQRRSIGRAEGEI